MRNVILILCLCSFLATCGGRSVLTADLTKLDKFRPFVGKELKLASGQQTWLLLRDPYDPLTNFSEGYKLSLVATERAIAIVSGELQPPNTPVGLYEVVGVVDGRHILIDRIHEYGMETPSPVVLGHITLSDGRSYPFEAEWRPSYTAQVNILDN